MKTRRGHLDFLPETIMCVWHPSRKAVAWMGHIHRERKHILAGWCRKCSDKKECMGCFGPEVRK